MEMAAALELVKCGSWRELSFWSWPQLSSRAGARAVTSPQLEQDLLLCGSNFVGRGNSGSAAGDRSFSSSTAGKQHVVTFGWGQ